MGQIDWTLALIVWIVCGIAAGWIAQTRGAPAVQWFVSGIVLGPLGVLLALFQAKPAQPTPVAATAIAAAPGAPAALAIPPAIGSQTTGQALQCPHCSQPIARDAAFCPSCGGRLSMSASSSSHPLTAETAAAAAGGGNVSKILVALVVAAVLIGGAYLFGRGLLASVNGPGGGSTGVTGSTPNLPSAGSVWFGTSFDPTSFEVRGQSVSFATGITAAYVAHTTRPVSSGDINIRLTVNGVTVANQPLTLNGPGGATDVFGATLNLAIAGTWQMDVTDLGGNTLASGQITVH